MPASSRARAAPPAAIAWRARRARSRSPRWSPRSTARSASTQCSIHEPVLRAHAISVRPGRIGSRINDVGRHRARGGHARRDGAGAARLPARACRPQPPRPEASAMTGQRRNARHRPHARRGLQIRLRHRHRERAGAARPQRGHRPLHLGQEGRAGMAARLAARMPSATGRQMESPDWAKLRIAPIDYQAASYYSAPKQKDAPEIARRGRSRAAADLREARHSAARARGARRASRSMRCSTASRSPPPSRPSSASSASSSARSARRCASIPSWCANISARSCRRATISSPRSIRPCSATAPSSMCRRACAARWSFRPISASTPPRPASSSAPSSSPTRAAM